MLATYSIPESNLNDLKAKLTKLVAKSAKLGVGAVSFEVGGHVDTPFLRSANEVLTRFNEENHGSLSRLEQVGQIVWVRHFEVVVKGETPRLAGWEFMATLQHLEVEGERRNVLRSIPGVSLPAEFRSASPENCDHCQRAIKTRKETFVVRHEDGTWKQVGRSCTQDFLGGKNPHAVASALGLLLQATGAASEAEGLGGGSGGAANRFAISTFLAAAAREVRTGGWVSRTAARERYDDLGRSTANLALEYLTPPQAGSQAYADWSAYRTANPVTAEDIQTAEEALEYARETLSAKEDMTDYEHNLFVAVSQETVDYQLAGIVASVLPFHNKAMVQKLQQQSLESSQHFGEAGKRLKGLVVSLLRENVIENHYGATFIYKFVTAEGNVCTWFASRNQGLKVGAEYKMDATVKEHKEYKGVKETVLTRGKVAE